MESKFEVKLRTRSAEITVHNSNNMYYVAARLARISAFPTGLKDFYIPLLFEPYPPDIIKMPVLSYYKQGKRSSNNETEYWNCSVGGSLELFPKDMPQPYHDYAVTSDFSFVDVVGVKCLLLRKSALVVSSKYTETSARRIYDVIGTLDVSGVIGVRTVRFIGKSFKLETSLTTNEPLELSGEWDWKYSMYPDYPADPEPKARLAAVLRKLRLTPSAKRVSAILRSTPFEDPETLVSELRERAALAGHTVGYSTEKMIVNIPGFHDMNLISYVKDLKELPSLATQLTTSVSQPIKHFKELLDSGDLRKIKNFAKDAGNAVLIKQFAVDTSLSDTYEIDETLAFLNNYQIPPIQTYRGRYTAEINDDSGTESWTATFNCRASIDMMPDEIREPILHLKKECRKLFDSGFAPTLTTLWDMVPYSFVINWIVPVDDLASSIDHLAYQQTLNVVNCTYSEKYEQKYPLTYLGIDENDWTVKGKIGLYAYHRWPTKSLVDVPIALPKLDLSGWGFNNRLLLATSLVLQKT